MIALLLAAAQAAMPVPAPREDEIVVVARQLRTIRLSYHVKDGQLLSCRVSGPAVLPIVASIACDAARRCAAEQPTAGDRGLAPCVKMRAGELFADYRARRAVTPPASSPR